LKRELYAEERVRMGRSSLTDPLSSLSVSFLPSMDPQPPRKHARSFSLRIVLDRKGLRLDRPKAQKPTESALRAQLLTTFEARAGRPDRYDRHAHDPLQTAKALILPLQVQRLIAHGCLVLPRSVLMLVDGTLDALERGVGFEEAGGVFVLGGEAEGLFPAVFERREHWDGGGRDRTRRRGGKVGSGSGRSGRLAGCQCD
jgi:hypothetical protein